MRWPFMTKARHDREAQLVVDIKLAAFRQEVHDWARDAASQFMYIDGTRAKGAAMAAFKQAQDQFGPPPITLTDALTRPADVEEAIFRAL